MGTPGIRGISFNSNENVDVTVNSDAGTAATDLLLAIHGTDFYTLAGMTTPTPGTWDARTTADRGANSVHLKSWTRLAGAASVQSVTFPKNSDAVNHGVLLTLSGTSVAFDVGAGGFSNGANGDAPSVDPVNNNDLLVCAWITNAAENFTVPGTMIKQVESDFNPWSSICVATQVLTADTATGVRNATWSASRAWASLALTISAADTPSGYTVSVWNGTSEVTAALEGVWNGTSVTPATIGSVV